MKRLLSAVLVCAVLLSSFSGMVSFAGYQLNKSFIAKVLCINKEVPEKNCQGKCHLKKSLRNKKISKRILVTRLTINNSIFLMELVQPSTLIVCQFSFRQNSFKECVFFNKPVLNSVFHPPAIAVC